MSVVRTGSTHILQNPGQPTRTLSVDFDAFVERLVSLGEPRQKELDALAAALSLIRAMESESDDFGSAAPTAGDRADFAERVAAITDEAFEAAHILLEEGGDYDEDAPLTPKNVLARAVRERTFDDDLYPQVVKTILASPVECDPRVSGEFV